MMQNLGMAILLSNIKTYVNWKVISATRMITMIGVALLWFTDYLSGRTQQVQCNGALSTFRYIKCGVPQGSNLGPLLFLLYINDLPNATKVLKYILFADDTNAFCCHDSLTELKNIINDELII